jgi:hypothetical protein
MAGEKFGEFVRRAREEKDIGLREMAEMIGDLFVEGGAGRVRATGRGQGQGDCADHRLRRGRIAGAGGRVASDLSDIIRPPVGTGGAAADHKGIDNGRHRPAGPQRAEGEGRVRLGANRQKMQMRIGDQ